MLANLLTTVRLLLVVPTALSFAFPRDFPAWAPLVFMLGAIITDISDGKVARAFGTASPYGQLFDHSADCLFVASVLVGAAWADQVTSLLPVLVLLAFAQYALDSRFLHKQKQLRMSGVGRWNGFLYFVPPLGLAIAALLPGVTADLLRVCVYWFAWALVFSTVFSMIDRAAAHS